MLTTANARAGGLVRWPRLAHEQAFPWEHLTENQAQAMTTQESPSFLSSGLRLTHLCSSWIGHTFCCGLSKHLQNRRHLLEAGAFMVLNVPVSPAPGAPQALLVADALEDGGCFLKASHLFHQTIPPSPREHSHFLPI